MGMHAATSHATKNLEDSQVIEEADAANA